MGTLKVGDKLGTDKLGTDKLGTDGTFTSFSVGSDALRNRGTSRLSPHFPHGLVVPAMPEPHSEVQMMARIYCDTDTLFSNINRYENEPKAQRELEALGELLAYHRAGQIEMFRSLINRRELEETKSLSQLENLRADYESLPPLPKDERPYGSEFLVTDPHGGCISNPLVSDVQDEAICAEVTNRGLTIRDAQHITQAVCNRCDIFMTRDETSIIKPYRMWIQSRFLALKVCLPSEAVAEVRAGAFLLNASHPRRNI